MVKTLAEVACMSDEIKQIILKRFKYDRRFNSDMDALCTAIESAKSCDSGDKRNIKVTKGSRKKSERSAFMGTCMRGKEKGGMAKDMKTCSDIFKGMSKEEKARVMKGESNVNK